MSIERDGLKFDGDGQSSTIEISGTGLIVAIRVRASDQEPAEPRALAFGLERQSGGVVLHYRVRPYDAFTWFAPPGNEIVAVSQHGLVARCDGRRPLDIAYRGLDLGSEIKGVHLDAAGLRDMSQPELDQLWRTM